MADTAFQTQFRQEFIATFEEKQSWLRRTCVTEAVVKGNTATFLVAGSGGASAVSRGSNGLIPARADDLTQTSATLQEWHDLVRKTGFNIFASQGDQRRIMQETTVGVLNRKIDADIIAQLDTATVNTGAAATASVAMVADAIATLGEAEVPVQEEDKMFAVVTPKFMSYLMQIPEFASADYVEMKPYSGANLRLRRWFGVNWILHPNLTGVGTASEKTYLYHMDAIGHAMEMGEGMKTAVGYDDEQDYSYARASGFFGSKKLQDSGIVQMLHIGNA